VTERANAKEARLQDDSASAAEARALAEAARDDLQARRRNSRHTCTNLQDGWQMATTEMCVCTGTVQRCSGIEREAEQLVHVHVSRMACGCLCRARLRTRMQRKRRQGRPPRRRGGSCGASQSVTSSTPR
jgi:hypothetical protein